MSDTDTHSDADTDTANGNTTRAASRARLPHSEAYALDDLIEVAPGSVVSRTLLRRGTGNITLFSFDTGEGLSEHTAPFDAFIQVVSGAVELTIGGEPVPATAGQVVVMPADVPHSVLATEPLKMLLVMIRDPKPQG
jgi:quercetin dioxygenase-like cupin family protein